MFLSPVKLLVILVVALAVLGPESLPRVAKQIGGFWGQFKSFRQSLETQVRGSFPDLPSTETITQAVRSPLSFLDTLADRPDPGAPEASTGGPAPVTDHGVPADPPSADPLPTEPAPSDPFERLAEELQSVDVLVGQPVGAVHLVRNPVDGGPHDPGLN
jgi:Sec-independent protein translocase protein TatA